MKKERPVCHLISTQIEVGTGRPGYRWTNGYFVTNPKPGQTPADAKIYPPVVRKEAYALAREIHGANVRVIFD